MTKKRSSRFTWNSDDVEIVKKGNKKSKKNVKPVNKKKK